jgi:ribokinase
MLSLMAIEVVVLGGLNLDLVVQVDTLPRPGETVTGDRLALHPGGKGANQAVAAARRGARTAMVGRLGTDDAARLLRASLDEAGVDCRAVGVDPNAASGVALISVDRQGQNQIVVAPGANARVQAADLAAAAGLFAEARVCLLVLETPLPSVVEAAERARTAGARVVLNAAPAAPLPAELLRLVDLLVVNETEAAELLGLAELADPARSARSLRGLGSAAVTLTLGDAGLWLAESGQERHLPAFAVEAVDTTAAGDAFCGGLAVALSQGADLWAACRYGSAAGALSVTRAGAQPSLPTTAEVAALLVRVGHE